MKIAYIAQAAAGTILTDMALDFTETFADLTSAWDEITIPTARDCDEFATALLFMKAKGSQTREAIEALLVDLTEPKLAGFMRTMHANLVEIDGLIERQKAMLTIDRLAASCRAPVEQYVPSHAVH